MPSVDNHGNRSKRAQLRSTGLETPASTLKFRTCATFAAPRVSGLDAGTDRGTGFDGDVGSSRSGGGAQINAFCASAHVISFTNQRHKLGASSIDGTFSIFVTKKFDRFELQRNSGDLPGLDLRELGKAQ
jgi:hypothetical protein